MGNTIWDEAFDANQTFVDPGVLEAQAKQDLRDAGLIKELPQAPIEPEPVIEAPSLDLMGLLEIGHLTAEVDAFRGQRILIKTLKVGEELRAALVAQKYQGIAQSDELKAYFTATVAACIVSVNGMPLISALGPNEDLIELKYNYILENWNWPVVEEVYKQYIELQKRSEVALEEIKKK